MRPACKLAAWPRNCLREERTPARAANKPPRKPALELSGAIRCALALFPIEVVLTEPLARTEDSMADNGPAIHANWREMLKGVVTTTLYEVPIFTDAQITGMITEGYGPYQFLNTVPIENEF